MRLIIVFFSFFLILSCSNDDGVYPVKPTNYQNGSTTTPNGNVSTPTNPIILIYPIPDINIGQTSASCVINVSNIEQFPITSQGICWSSTDIPTVNNPKNVSGPQSGNVTLYLTGLYPNTTYQVRGFASTQAGTYYSDEVMIFQTRSIQPGLIWKISSKDYVNSQELTTNTTYSYNNLNLIAGINSYRSIDIFNSSSYVQYFTYESGKLTLRTNSETHSGHSGVNTQHYAFQTMYSYTGDLITSDVVNYFGNPYNTNLYQYDNVGRIVNAEKRNFSNNSIISQTSFQNYINENYLEKMYTSYTNTNSSYTMSYTYDDKKNPYRLGHTTEYIKLMGIPYNNPTSDGNVTYEYIYNSNDYPTKITTKVNNVITNITDITYY